MSGTVFVKFHRKNTLHFVNSTSKEFTLANQLLFFFSLICKKSFEQFGIHNLMANWWLCGVDAHLDIKHKLTDTTYLTRKISSYVFCPKKRLHKGAS
jgi:hypothetical protein